MAVAAQRAMTSREWALLLLLSLLWGGSFFRVGVAVRDLPPLMIVALRVVLAAAILWALSPLTGGPFARQRQRARSPRCAWARQ